MDAVERTRSLRGFDVFLACTPGMEHPFFQTLAARYRIRLWEQVGEDLGQRMDHALTAVFDPRVRACVACRHGHSQFVRAAL